MIVFSDSLNIQPGLRLRLKKITLDQPISLHKFKKPSYGGNSHSIYYGISRRILGRRKKSLSYFSIIRRKFTQKFKNSP
jgi:hypothetical protein